MALPNIHHRSIMCHIMRISLFLYAPEAVGMVQSSCPYLEKYEFALQSIQAGLTALSQHAADIFDNTDNAESHMRTHWRWREDIPRRNGLEEGPDGPRNIGGGPK